MAYYFSQVLDKSFDKDIQKVTDELKKEGFGILTDIDVQQTLKKKLDVDFQKYRIFGACNPFFVYKAMQLKNKIGTMLPCNVVVQELDDGKVEIATIDPVASMQAVENQGLREVADQVQSKLKRVIDRL